MIKWLSGVNKVLTILLLTVCVSVFGFADSFWEGSVTTANYGVLPDTGYYGASNAFPLNADVVVTNTENGKSVDVTILKRLDSANVFIALSPEAGEKIGVRRGQVVSGSMAVKGSAKAVQPVDRGVSRDPEINPAGGGDKELALIQEYIQTELSGKDAEPVKQPPKKQAVVTPPKPAAVQKSGQPALPVKKKPSVPDVIVLPQGLPAGSAEKSAALPVPLIAQKAIRESEKPSVYDFPVSSPEAAGKKIFRADAYPAISDARVPEDTPLVLHMIARPGEKRFTPGKLSLPAVARNTAPAETGKPVIITARLPEALSSPLPEEPSPLPAITPEKKPVETVEAATPVPQEKTAVRLNSVSPLPSVKPVKEVSIVLEPAQPKPPVPLQKAPDSTASPSGNKSEPPGPAAAAVNRPAEEVVAPGSTYNVSTRLKKGVFYLQLGVYDEAFAAKDLARTLSGRYPVTVFVAKKTDKSMYKVLVGPLNEDEGGSLLFNFRARGYPDAFLRRSVK